MKEVSECEVGRGGAITCALGSWHVPLGLCLLGWGWGAKGRGRGTRMRACTRPCVRPGRVAGTLRARVTAENKPLYPTATWSGQVGGAGFVGDRSR